jgi:hypothetical protein
MYVERGFNAISVVGPIFKAQAKEYIFLALQNCCVQFLHVPNDSKVDVSIKFWTKDEFWRINFFYTKLSHQQGPCQML